MKQYSDTLDKVIASAKRPVGNNPFSDVLKFGFQYFNGSAGAVDLRGGWFLTTPVRMPYKRQVLRGIRIMGQRVDAGSFVYTDMGGILRLTMNPTGAYAKVLPLDVTAGALPPAGTTSNLSALNDAAITFSWGSKYIAAGQNAIQEDMVIALPAGVILSQSGFTVFVQPDGGLAIATAFPNASSFFFNVEMYIDVLD